MLRCEVCGCKIRENPNRVVIEGAKLYACNECAKHGTATWEEAPKLKFSEPQRSAAPGAPLMRGPIQIKKRNLQARVDTSQEIIQDYSEVIRQAREKSGLSTEELGMKINEKESVLRKIETGKISPNDLLVSKLERTLKIKLLVPVAEEKVSQNLPKTASRELTLGDVMKADKKGKGE